MQLLLISHDWCSLFPECFICRSVLTLFFSLINVYPSLNCSNHTIKMHIYLKPNDAVISHLSCFYALTLLLQTTKENHGPTQLLDEIGRPGYRAASHDSLAVQKLIPFLNLCSCLSNSCFLVQSKEAYKSQ
jgi:hypothetical protein